MWTTSSPIFSFTVASANIELPRRRSEITTTSSTSNGGDVAGPRAAAEQLERALRRLELVALALEVLDALEHRALVPLHVDAQLGGAHADVAAARQLGHDDVAAVAHLLGDDVLVARRDLLDRGDVHAPLVRERRVPDVGGVRARADVGDLAHLARELGEPGEVLVGDAAPAHLELQPGDDRDQVGVAATLAPAVDRPLHLRAARLDGGERVGDRHVAVVVGVDAEPGGDRSRARRPTTSAMIAGRLPPFVSHIAIQSAPAAAAAFTVASA